ncbi:MAG: adenylate/guanylate cyclase domain-containing protein [Deltaproteobacteria bacterium]|nr:adenylate/guanylate cyclase domain-containing protein [Deltaproteobacteria bacterium]
MFRFTCLRHKLMFYVLLPTALLLLGFGIAGFIYTRHNLLEEWQEAAILRLERAAHQLDMRLSTPLNWIDIFVKNAVAGNPGDTQEWILGQLRGLEGVKEAEIVWQEEQGGKPNASPPCCPVGAAATRFLYEKGQEAVTLETSLLDQGGGSLGRLRVNISFAYLMQDILSFGWQASYLACLVDEDGRYLAHTDPHMKGMGSLGETGDPLDRAILKAMQTQHSGTLLGPGHPPERVAGFYHLHTAPWVIVLYARGDQILAPIIRFRFYYALAGFACIIIILGLIRLGTRPMIRSIQKIAQAAGQVAQGHYGEPLPVKCPDEIGRLTQSFNEMVAGLKERDYISNTFGRYMDPKIARELLKKPEAAVLGGEKRAVAILFADLRAFTPIAENLTPEETIRLVNRFFSEMIEVIQQHRGIIVDFFGDGILAFFDPLDGPLAPEAHQAAACALAMQEAMGDINTYGRYIGLPTLHLAVGVHVGDVVVGNIGSETRAKYGIVGAAVNLTHRIQGELKGGEVGLSEDAYRLFSEPPAVKRSFYASLKGIQEPVTLFVIDKLGEEPQLGEISSASD